MFKEFNVGLIWPLIMNITASSIAIYMGISTADNYVDGELIPSQEKIKNSRRISGTIRKDKISIEDFNTLKK